MEAMCTDYKNPTSQTTISMRAHIHTRNEGSVCYVLTAKTNKQGYQQEFVNYVSSC